MAEITNPQVKKFVSEEVRGLANSMYQSYWRAKQFLTDYSAGSIGSLINDAGAGNLIEADLTDGRTRLTGGDIYNLVTAATDFVAYVEGGSVSTAERLQEITKPHVND